MQEKSKINSLEVMDKLAELRDCDTFESLARCTRLIMMYLKFVYLEGRLTDRDYNLYNYWLVCVFDDMVDTIKANEQSEDI